MNTSALTAAPQEQKQFSILLERQDRHVNEIAVALDRLSCFSSRVGAELTPPQNKEQVMDQSSFLLTMSGLISDSETLMARIFSVISNLEKLA